MKVLIAGLGSIGQRHLRNLSTLVGDELEVLAYRVRRETPLLTDSLSVDMSSDVEARFGIRPFYDLDAALAEGPDLALVCNPTSFHVDTAQKAAESGCNLLIEKPLSDSLSGIDALADTVERKRLVALVAYQWRFHPLLRRVRDLLNDGAIGRIVSVQAEVGEFLPDWHSYEDYRRMYASRRDQGGGVVLTQSHEIDYLLWLFGRPTRTFAIGGHRSGLDIDVEDTADILMDCGGVPTQLHQDYLQRPPRRTLRIVGDEGKIVGDLLAPRMEVYRAGDRVEEDCFEGFTRQDMFMAEMKHLLDCLEGRTAPLVTVRGGRASLEVALGALRSMETGEVVALQ